MNNFYDIILKILKPLIIRIGRLHMPFTHKKITGEHYYMWRGVIEPGTVFLSSTKGEFSNLINPIDIKHGAIYIGKDANGVCWVLEALGKGVQKTDLVSFMTSKDILVALEPNFLGPSDKHKIMNEAKKLVGIPYDYVFKKSKDALYCFEAVVSVLQNVRPDIEFKCTEIIKNKLIYDHNTFLEDNKFTILFDSRSI